MSYGGIASERQARTTTRPDPVATWPTESVAKHQSGHNWASHTVPTDAFPRKRGAVSHCSAGTVFTWYGNSEAGQSVQTCRRETQSGSSKKCANRLNDSVTSVLFVRCTASSQLAIAANMPSTADASRSVDASRSADAANTRTVFALPNSHLEDLSDVLASLFGFGCIGHFLQQGRLRANGLGYDNLYVKRQIIQQPRRGEPRLFIFADDFNPSITFPRYLL